MPQLSKLIRGRDGWKTKAVQRANEIRGHQKTIKRRQGQIAGIKRQLNALQQAAEDNKKTLGADDRASCWDDASSGSSDAMCFNDHPSGRALPSIPRTLNPLNTETGLV